MKSIAYALAFGLAAVSCAPAQAMAGGAPPNRPADYRQWHAAPDELVRTSVDRLTGFLLGVPEVTPGSLGSFLDSEIAPLFDFDYMAQWSAGRYWRRLDDEQRARMGTLLKSLFLDALARNLGIYAQPLPRIDVFPATTRDPEARVLARVVGDGGLHVRLQFRFYWSDRGWRMFDVVANGASAVAYYRGYFRELLRRDGPEALDR